MFVHRHVQHSPSLSIHRECRRLNFNAVQEVEGEKREGGPAVNEEHDSLDPSESLV